MHTFAVLVLYTGREADRPMSESREIFTKKDSFSVLGTLRTYSGGEVHGWVGRRFNTDPALQSAMCHVSRLQANGRTMSQVCIVQLSGYFREKKLETCVAIGHWCTTYYIAGSYFITTVPLHTRGCGMRSQALQTCLITWNLNLVETVCLLTERMGGCGSLIPDFYASANNTRRRHYVFGSFVRPLSARTYVNSRFV